jgi:hypothetical protein
MEKHFKKWMIDNDLNIKKVAVILDITYPTAHKKVNNPHLFSVGELQKLKANNFINLIF